MSMHFCILLKVKVIQLMFHHDNRQTEYQRKLKEATSGQLTQEDVNKLEVRVHVHTCISMPLTSLCFFL